MSSSAVAFLSLLAAALPSAPGTRPGQAAPLFPVPKAELVIEPTEQGPKLLELVQQYAALSDQHVVLTSVSRDTLAQISVVLDRPVRVPPPEVQSFFESILAQNDCSLFLLRERAPRLVTVVPAGNFGGRQPSLPPPPLFVPIERIGELRDHPALYARTVLALEHSDVRQLANAMRTILPQGAGGAEMLINLGASNALILQGRGASVADLVEVLRVADAHSTPPAPPSPSVSPAVAPPAPSPAPK